MDSQNEDKLRAAQAYEEQKDHKKAINSQLSLSEEDIENVDTLCQYWDHALNLTMKFEKDKVNQVVIEVVKRLKKLNRHEQAAEQQENFGYPDQAIQSYILANAFEKAKACCKNIKNSEQYEKYMNLIDERMKKQFKNNNDAEQLVNSGDVVTGLDMLVKQGQ